MTRRLRFVVFSPSIVSDFGNPSATTVRALCQALIELGHDVVHCEERRNRHVVDLLIHRGPEPLRAFNRAFPLLTYRQFDVLSGAARRVWFSREISTADVVIGFDGCEAGVAEEIRALSSDRIVTLWPADDQTRTRWFEPAVLPREFAEPRTVQVAVGYDHAVRGSDGITRYSAGTLFEQGWERVTELGLPEWYGRAERVRFAADDVSGAGYARALLAVASGARAEIVNADGGIVEIVDRLAEANDARVRAANLSAYVIRELDARVAESLIDE